MFNVDTFVCLVTKCSRLQKEIVGVKIIHLCSDWMASLCTIGGYQYEFVEEPHNL